MRSLFALLAITCAALAAEGVPITFLPPPLDGTLSVGIYTLDGKLVRTHSREALPDAFTIGLNGLITSWDGKDDAGVSLPAGKYFVRGFAVGEIAVEGEAFHGNDWLDEDDVPRLRELRSVKLDGRTLMLGAITSTGAAGELRLDLESSKRTFVAAEPTEPARTAPGRDGSTWSIETDGALVQRKGDEVLRQLAPEPTEPQPFALAAATDRDELFLLERNATESRLRALRLKETKSADDGKVVSEWEVFLSKSIYAQDTFAQAAPHIGRPQPPSAEERLRVALMPNELLQTAPVALQLIVAIDDKGSILRTLDGLPLRRVTDTPNLKWAVLSREPDGAVTLFQSDGAVIEEYRLRHIERMMAFDAGEYEWTGAK
jgi:hypothetical protein